MSKTLADYQLDRRRFLYAGGLAVATTTLLASCSFAGGGGGTTTAGTFMGWGSDTEKKNVGAAAAAFNKGRPKGDQVTYQFVANDGYDTKINTLIASNKIPALSYQSEGTAMRLGAQGHLESVLDHVDKYPALGDFLPNVVHRWAPGKAVTQLAVEMFMMWYNVDALKEAGVPTPPTKAADAWTWDEFVQYADKLTFDTSGRHPSEPGFDSSAVKQFGTIAPTGWPGFFPLLRSNGTDIVNDAGTQFEMNSDAATEVLSKIHDLMYVHRVAPTPTQYQTFSSPFTAGLLSDRRVAMVLDGQWNLLDLGSMNFKYGIGVMPKFKEPKTINLCNALAVGKGGGHVDDALELLLYLGDPTKNELFAKGLWMPLQGKYYKNQSDIDSWVDNPVHPAGFKEAALDYLVECGEPEPAYRVKNWDQISNLFGADLNEYFSTKADASKLKTILASTQTKVEPLLKGVYPDTKE